MMHKILADECTFGLTVRLLRNKGFDIQRIQDIGMAGCKDRFVYDMAKYGRGIDNK